MVIVIVFANIMIYFFTIGVWVCLVTRALRMFSIHDVMDLYGLCNVWNWITRWIAIMVV